MNENSLEHYGVLGMKWGIRKDKTKTSKFRSKTNAAKAYAKRKQTVRNKRLYSARNADILSDKQLNDLTSRIRRERDLKDLVTKEYLSPSRTNKILKDVGDKLLTSVIAGVSVYATKNIISNMFNNSEVANYVVQAMKPKK